MAATPPTMLKFLDYGHPVKPDDAEELLGRARTGDHEALDSLLKYAEPRIVRYIDTMLDHRLRAVCEPADVLQEVAVRVCRGLPTTSFIDVNAFHSWVASVTKNVITDLARRHLQARAKWKRPKSLHETVGSDSIGGNRHLVDLLTNTISGAHTHAVRNEAVLVFRKAMTRLPEDYQHVIQWCVLEGLPRDQVATLMGRNSEAVRALLGRALEALAKVLRELGYASSTGGEPVQ